MAIIGNIPYGTTMSMDWFKGKSTGKPHRKNGKITLVSGVNCPVKTNPITMGTHWKFGPIEVFFAGKIVQVLLAWEDHETMRDGNQ